MENKNVFMSFSSKDQPDIQEIISQLKLQNIKVWDYSEEGQEIKLGASIPEELREMVDKCEYFIAIVSKNSVDPNIGHFTRMEVQYAIDRDMLPNREIIPVVLTQCKPDVWYSPYDVLKDICHLEVDTRNIREFIAIIERLCREMGVIYIPPFDKEHPRLPFWRRFRDEVYSLPHSNAAHGELMKIIAEFDYRFSEKKWEEAHFLISLFLELSRYKIVGERLFYSWIVKAVCEHNMGLLDKAEKTYLHAGTIRPTDENVYGGLGQVYLQRQDFVKAEEFFRKAIVCCPADLNFDECFNHIVSLIELCWRQSNNVEACLSKLVKENKKVVDRIFAADHNSSCFPNDARYKIMNVKGILYYALKDYQSAINVFSSMKELGIHDTTSVVYNHLILYNIGKSSEAINLLQSAIEDSKCNPMLDPDTLYDCLADLYYRLGKYDKVLEIYRKYFLKSENKKRRFVVKYMRFLKHMDHKSDMEIVCKDMLDDVSFTIPKSREDFYFEGFAYYLINKYEMAKYIYRLSGNFDQYYSEYET